MFQGTIFEDHRDQEEVMEILRSNKTKQKLAKFAKFKSKHFQTPLKDRVFVCLGKLGPENDSKKYAWVMTISRNYETVTFWDPVKPIKYVLEGRINYKETKWLQNYLSPILTSKEKNLERQEKRKKQKAEQMKKQEELIKKQKEQEQTLKSTQGKPKTSKFNFNLFREKGKLLTYILLGKADEDEFSSIEDNMSEDLASIDDVHVTLNDLRQDLRGKFINLIGSTNSQDKTKQSKLQ